MYTYYIFMGIFVFVVLFLFLFFVLLWSTRTGSLVANSSPVAHLCSILYIPTKIKGQSDLASGTSRLEFWVVA